MAAISADSHVVEGPDVFSGLAERFGDETPRVVAVCARHPDLKIVVAEMFGNHPEEARERIARGNVMEVYGL